MSFTYKQLTSTSKGLFEALANNCNEYIYAWSFSDGKYLVSDAFAHDFSIPNQGDDFLQLWHKFVHARDYERVKEVVQQAVANKKERVRLEYQVNNTRGHDLWLSDSFTIFYNEESKEAELMVGAMHNMLMDGEVDIVTGLLMHNKCRDFFESKVQERVGVSGSVMLLGIDEFATINTLNSHSFGDLVLRESAQAFYHLLPDDFEMYRYDGDQFLIVGNNVDKKEMMRVYKMLKTHVGTPKTLDDTNYRFTISAGIASFPDDGNTWAQLEKSVSIALKIAKETGKNHGIEFTKQMLEEKMEEQSLVQCLSNDIEHNFRGFSVVYQPICVARDLRVKGAEILLRYRTADGTALGPDQFIPLLEQTQLIMPVGLWVLEEAIKTCKKWTKHIANFVMNVNVSYLQLRSLTFSDDVENLLKKYDLDVRHITIELTESYFITDAANINVTMDRLQNLHLQVAMDDFGTGYSSLARLSQFNVDVVKIDRSFVQSLHRSKYNHDFIDSVIRLCHNVGMKVCVEGVETSEEQESICVLNADFIQGYYVSRPIIEEQFYVTYIIDKHANDELIVVPNDALMHNQIVSDKDVLHALMEATPLGLSFWNRKLEMIACNKEVIQLFQATDFKDVKECFFDFSLDLQPDGKSSKEKARELLMDAFSGNVEAVYWTHCTREGEVIPTELSFARIPYMGDYLVASYSRDMRAQKKMEETIEKFNARLKAILDASPLCLNLWNYAFENTMCNKAAVDLFALRDQEEYMERFFELSPMYQPDGTLSDDKALMHIKKAFENGYEKFQWMHTRLDGEEIPAEITLVKIEGLDEEGKDLVAGYTRDLRAQKTMEKEVRNFNTKLKAILDATPLCLNLWNKNMDNTMCNKAAVELFELKDTDEYMERFFELSPELQPDGSISSEQAVLHIKKAFDVGRDQFQWMHKKINGEPIPSEITLVKIEGLGQEEEGLVAGYTRDLRAQKSLEETIEGFNKQLKAILDATPLCLNLWNESFENTMCNYAAVDLFALDSEEEYMRRFFELSPKYQPDGQLSDEKAVAHIKHAFKTGRDEFLWMHNKLNGEEIPTEITLVKIHGLGLNGADLVAGYTRDMREQVRTQKMQDTINQRVQALLDSSPLACILWAKDNYIIDCNQAVVTMLGADSKEEVATSFNSFLPHQQPDGSVSVDKVSALFKKVMIQGDIIFEWVYINKAGEEVPTEVKLVSLNLEGEDMVVAYTRDLRELHHTLEINDRLSRMAYYDMLTGVISRARFVEKMEGMFIDPKQMAKSHALIIFDIDCFKNVNDTFGHTIGDAVLKGVSKCVGDTMPAGAVLGRFGGDEFVVLLDNIDPPALDKILVQTVKAVEALSFTSDDMNFRTSISMGASFKQSGDTDYHQLLGRADKALYAAKKKGRNGYIVI